MPDGDGPYLVLHYTNEGVKQYIGAIYCENKKLHELLEDLQQQDVLKSLNLEFKQGMLERSPLQISLTQNFDYGKDDQIKTLQEWLDSAETSTHLNKNIIDLLNNVVHIRQGHNFWKIAIANRH